MRGMPTAQLPDRIEIFRSGRHIDDQGVAHVFTPGDVADMAASYDPAVREAPLTVGHPEHNRPAYGWVKGLVVEGERLVMQPGDVEPQFAEMVSQRRFPKRSASFYPPSHPNNPTPGRWYLRHVAFLGAQPPAISGLKDIQFADDDAGAISFSEGEGDDPHARNPGSLPPEGAASALGRPGGSRAPTQTEEDDQMDKELQAKLDAAEKAKSEAEARATAAEQAKQDADARLAQFAEQQRTERHAGFVSFAEQQVHAGKLLPKDKEAAVAVLDVLADAKPVEFAEGGAQKKLAPAEWLKGLIAAAKPVVSFGEHAPGNTGHDNPPADDAELDRRARDYARQHNVNYAEALSRVTASFTASA